MIKNNHGINKITKCLVVKPGKGGAYMQTETKDIKTGKKANHRYRSNEKVETLEFDEASSSSNNYQVLYRKCWLLSVMNMESFDQMELSTNLITPPNDGVFN